MTKEGQLALRNPVAVELRVQSAAVAKYAGGVVTKTTWPQMRSFVATAADDALSVDVRHSILRIAVVHF